MEDNSSGLTQDAVPVTLGRYVKLWIDAPTQGGDSAARIYEVEVKGLDKEIEMPPVYIEKVSAAVLEYAVELAGKADTDNVVDAVKNNFDRALENAQNILARIQAGDTSVTQAEVDQAWQDLIKAIQYLEFKPGDKTDLGKVIALADEMNSRLDSYLDAGKEAFTSALAKAKEVYADGNAFQEDTDSAWQNLLNAMAKLMLKPDKGLLKDLITQAEALNETDYDVESFTVMRFALAAAKEVFENENAVQEEVETSVAALEDAMAKLVLAENSGSAGADNKTAAGDEQNGVSSDKNNIVSSAGKTQAAPTGDTTDLFPFAAAGVAAAMIAACAATFGKKKR